MELTSSLRSAVAVTVTLSLVGLAYPAQADQKHACTVLVCLANPNGPRAVAECVPPINKLFRDLARGRSFPHCNLSSSSQGSARAEPKQSLYDSCPAGTGALRSGARAVQGAAGTPSYSFRSEQVRTGIGEGDNIVPNGLQSPAKVCVGNKVADTYVTDSNGRRTRVQVFDRVTMLDPQASPNVIDVYLTQPGTGEQLYRRVRW